MMEMRNTRSIFDRNIRLAVKTATVMVQSEAQNTHRFTSRTGDLEKAVDVRFSANGRRGEIFLNEGVASYARFVHEGTKPHAIFPKNKLALRFPKGGKFAFAKRVQHPGTKKDQFLFEALDTEQDEISAVFKRYTHKSIKEVTADVRSSGLSRTFIWK